MHVRHLAEGLTRSERLMHFSFYCCRYGFYYSILSSFLLCFLLLVMFLQLLWSANIFPPDILFSRLTTSGLSSIPDMLEAFPIVAFLCSWCQELVGLDKLLKLKVGCKAVVALHLEQEAPPPVKGGKLPDKGQEDDSGRSGWWSRSKRGLLRGL